MVVEQEVETLLGGYRILDLSDEGGMLCGKILGDLGADVIQIEPPGGSPARNIGPYYHDIPDPEKSLYWFWTALNKRGITMDIESNDGRDIFKRLVKKAHFVIESFPPGHMESLGLGYSELEKINPGIIMTSITPFGQTGPYAHYKATDIVGVSMGGMSCIYGEIDRGPVRINAPQFYFQGGVHGALGSIMAHYWRELTGEGQHVDVSCQQAVVLSLMIAAEMWDICKMICTGVGPGMGFMGKRVSQLIYPTKDGYVLSMLGGGAQAGMVTSSKNLTSIANSDGYLLDLKDFDWSNWDFMSAAINKALGVESDGTTIIDQLEKGLNEYFPTKRKQDLFDEAVAKDILLIPVCDPKDVVESPQLAAREFWVQVEHPELGETITYPGYPIKFNGLPSYKPQRRAPLIGEHNEEIYSKELDLTRDQLCLLKGQGVI
ncbi:MAG: CoA transferase [Spirochaetota bacterium]|nr:CoA transferase [Spirochaetota bacterium]